MKRVFFSMIAGGLLLTACGDAAPTARNLRDPISFGRQALPVAQVGREYNESFEIRGGMAPYQTRLSVGKLPEGLAINNNRLVGTPGATGSFSFSVLTVDANLSTRAQRYTLNVTERQLPRLSLGLPPAEVRGLTRLPLNISNPDNSRAMHVEWRLPEGATITRVQLGSAAGFASYKQHGQLLALDLGLKRNARPNEQIAVLYFSPSKPSRPDGSHFRYRILDASGEQIVQQPESTAAPKPVETVAKDDSKSNATKVEAAPTEAKPETKGPDSTEPESSKEEQKETP